MIPRRAIARVAGALAVLATGLLCAVPASAAQDGACSGPQGVTVVVDLTDLGGEVVVRCAGVLADGANGFHALEAAGFDVAQPLRTPGFVCRIDGRPGSGTEICVDTPPASAYWSYWSAPRGGAWQYNSLGAAARAVPPGSVEGWAFAKDRAAATVPAPRVAPPSPVATTVPAAPRPTTPPPPAGPPANSPPAAAAGSTTIRGQSAGPAATTIPVAGDPGGTVTTTAAPGVAVATTEQSATTTTTVGSSSTTTDASRVQVEVATAPSGADTGSTGGSGASTAVAAVLVAVLGAGAVAATRRRAAARRLDGDG